VTLPDNQAAPAQALTASGARSLPRVNLLPPEIHEAARFRKLQLAMAGAGVAALAVVGLLTVNAHHGVTQAQSDLSSAQSQQTNLQSQLAGLQSVRDIYAQVAGRKAMLRQALGSEIRWSYYLTDLSLKVPQNVWLTNVSATEQGTGAAATAAASGGALAPAGIGTINVTGVACSHDDVATWLDTLAKERGFTNAYFSNSTKASIGPREVVEFPSSVTLTQAALSGRYTAVEG
jgi:Tfp pilus assembly protein PilN